MLCVVVQLVYHTCRVLQSCAQHLMLLFFFAAVFIVESNVHFVLFSDSGVGYYCAAFSKGSRKVVDR